MTGFGIRHEDICTSLQIDKKTLYKHFRRELDTGMTEANVRVARALYANAVQHNNVAAQIWWTKTRMGWKDTSVVENGGKLEVEFRWKDEPQPAPLISGHVVEAASDVDTPSITFIGEC